MKKAISIVLLLTAVVPLLADAGVLSPFISTKNLFLRLATLVSFLLFSLLLVSDSSFVTDMRGRIKTLFKNKTFLFSILTILSICISALFFAFDKSIAFWGEGSRGEGMLSFIFLSIFFVLLCLCFEEKHWKWFFRISLFVSAVLFFSELYQFFGGMQRPESLLGNPNFLATYFIFSITSALLLLKKGTVEPAWNYLSYGTIATSLIGILITESRGALVGVVFGGVMLLVFLLVHRQTEKKIKKVAGVLLGSFIVFSSLFFATKQSSFWQHVPGISRLADFSLADATTQARLINTKEAIQSVSPQNEGVARFLFGWGWDNYTFAWQKYYDPALYRFDRGVFDRTHDKFFDLLAMAGVVTLLLYLLSLVFWMRDIFLVKRNYFWVSSVLFFWCTSYVVQNLFTFDTVTSYIAFYVLLAYTISLVRLQTYENK